MSKKIIVSPNGEYSKIQEAIDDASPGDLIEVHSGIYCENVKVDKKIALVGVATSGEKPVIDSCGKESAIMLLVNEITLRGFTAKTGILRDCRRSIIVFGLPSLIAIQRSGFRATMRSRSRRT